MLIRLDILQRPQDKGMSFSQESWTAVLKGVVRVRLNKDVCHCTKPAP